MPFVQYLAKSIFVSILRFKLKYTKPLKMYAHVSVANIYLKHG